MTLESMIYILIATIVVLILAYVRRWKKYDPGWLLDLAIEQHPGDIELHNAIKNCTRIKGNYFVSGDKPNQPRSEWQFERSVTLIHPEMDDIILDVLKDGRVGSIEYLGLMCRK